MHIQQKLTGISIAILILATAEIVAAQSGTNQGVPMQRPRTYQQQFGTPQQAPNQQNQATQYYNVTLTEQQKAQPSLGAMFYDAGSGMGVRSVYTNGPAQKAGINSGDFISKANGQAIPSVAAFNAMVARMKSGDTITLTKRTRSGKETDISCQLMTMGDIINASVVPEAGVYDTALLKAQQMLKSLEQQIKNAEGELADMKKRYASQQQQIADLQAKAEVERQKEKQLKAAEDAKRQQQMERMRRQAEEAAKGD